MRFLLEGDNFRLEYEAESIDLDIINGLSEVALAQSPSGSPAETVDNDHIKKLASQFDFGLGKKSDLSMISKTEDFSEPIEDEELLEEDPVKLRTWYERGERVGVSLNCPFCGLSREINGYFGNKFEKCPACKNKVFNAPATEAGYGHADERGNFYKADTPYYTPAEREAYENMFSESEEPGDDVC